MNEEQTALYNEFIRKGLSSGFTDSQVNFMWSYIIEVMLAIDRTRSK